MELAFEDGTNWTVKDLGVYVDLADTSPGCPNVINVAAASVLVNPITSRFKLRCFRVNPPHKV